MNELEELLQFPNNLSESEEKAKEKAKELMASYVIMKRVDNLEPHYYYLNNIELLHSR